MKTEIRSVELHGLVKEWQVLLNAKVEKIFHPEAAQLIFAFHVTGKGTQFLHMFLP